MSSLMAEREEVADQPLPFFEAFSRFASALLAGDFIIIVLNTLSVSDFRRAQQVELSMIPSLYILTPRTLRPAQTFEMDIIAGADFDFSQIEDVINKGLHWWTTR
jgi:hypothetical protein